MKTISLCGKGRCCPVLNIENDRSYTITEEKNGKSVKLSEGVF